MAVTFGYFILMLIAIILAAEIFTNALEHLGEKLKISEGVTGSLFAAVGTALPETIIPLIAIFSGHIGRDVANDLHSAGSVSAEHIVNEEIGVGAILGAPLMLSTLAFFLVGLAVLRKRGLLGVLQPEHTGFRRDLNFFIFSFILVWIAMYIPHHEAFVRLILSGMLFLMYFLYILLTLKASKGLVSAGHHTEAGKNLFFSWPFVLFTRKKQTLPSLVLWILIILQLIAGLAFLIYGANGFVQSVKEISQHFNVSALLISLLLVPIATELPEKVNSILWVRRHKDTLAFGNLTGAMVFQGTVLPAIGILLTAWEPQGTVVLVMAITLLAAIWLRYNLWRQPKYSLPVWIFGINGLLYFIYLTLILFL